MKLRDQMMKSLLQTNLNFLRRNENKLQCARNKRGAKDLHKITLLKLVSQRISGFIDMLKDREEMIDSISNYANKTTAAEKSRTKTQHILIDDEPMPYRSCRWKRKAHDFRPEKTKVEFISARHPKETLVSSRSTGSSNVARLCDTAEKFAIGITKNIEYKKRNFQH